MDLGDGDEAEAFAHDKLNSLSDSSVPQTCAKHHYLFVNETTSSPTFKVGGHRGTRTEVRKHVAKRFRETQKATGKSGPKGPQYPALASRAAVTESLEEGSRGPIQSFDTIHAAGLRVDGPSTAAPKELGHDNPLPLRDISDDPIQPEIDNHGSSASEIPADLTLSYTPEDYQPEKMFPARCVVCGSPLNALKMSRLMKENELKIIVKNLSRILQSSSSPLEALGAGRVDPFLCYPVKKPSRYLHELMDHSVTYLLPGLVPDGSNTDVNPVTKAWFSSSLNTPLLFHALVFAGSIHLDFLRWSKIYPNSPQALSHKLIVIHKLNEIMRYPERASRDEVILAILILSSHETMNKAEEKRSPFNSPLRSVQWLNVYGNIKYVPEHMKAVLDLVTLRGGLENLELHGLAETIMCGDVISATNSLSKPNLPPLRISDSIIESVEIWATSPPRLPIQLLGRGFLKFQDHGLTSDALFVFNAMGATTIAIDHYLDGKPAGLSLGAIARIRTAVQQRLMFLPPAVEIKEIPPAKPHVYECCRLTALIYAIGVIFPIPSYHAALQTLVSNLKNAIETSDIEESGSDFSDLLLWILLLGGIAALGKPERDWYVLKFATLVKSRGGAYDWESIENILEPFLWLESACGQGGRELFLEVRERDHRHDILE